MGKEKVTFHLVPKFRYRFELNFIKFWWLINREQAYVMADNLIHRIEKDFRRYFRFRRSD